MVNLLEKLPELLLGWYEQNKRVLPWRENRDPYRVWLSEIMLQQTRVEAVKGYYARFLENLPTVQALAECEDDRLHKLWEGLGYYSRVRNLKKAAGILVKDYGGRFPEDYEQILKLPGIGEYTAGAICSICFDLPTPAVDGNVLRVVSRLTDDTTPIDLPAQKKKVTEALRACYPSQAGDFTQALMELGATVCGPNRDPDCENCPCREICLAKMRGSALLLPVRLPKKEKKIQKRSVFILRCGDRYALVKRPDTGLLAGLWQFPDREGWLDAQSALEYVQSLGLHPRQIFRQTEKVHIFTHIRWEMRGFYLEVAEPIGDFIWVSESALAEEAALPTAYRQFWMDRQ